MAQKKHYLNQLNELALLACLPAIILLSPKMSNAQLSPGELSKPHAFLEGVKNCNQCHDFEKQLSADKCLDCHAPLARRVRAGQGLHRHPEYKKCQDCHVEHQGRDYQLIFWKDGQDKFDHSQTGYGLEGKHSGLECRKCHQSRNISDQAELLAKSINLDRSYLGLEQNCHSCHEDEHRGQFSSTTCEKCHAPTGWKPASGFDHNKTEYPLTGQHAKVSCGKCHPSVIDNLTKIDTAYIRFADIRHKQCLDCHQDIHQAKFGQNCESCHTTNGWQNVPQAQFDHAKTQFPLLGKHANVTCDKCHKPGQPLKIAKFDQCYDCHEDYHQGQFAQTTQSTACEKCHTVYSYAIAKYSVEDHAKTSYPLAGSHLAVPCDACHIKIMKDGKEAGIRFKFESIRCLGCHEDPHMGQVDKYVQSGGCEFCHRIDSWKTIDFDHSQTKFALDGRHKTAECIGCHEPITERGGEYHFTGLKMTCQDCHTDTHRGQFSNISAPGTEKITECNRCHTPDSWKAEKFDHNRDSAFKLDGAHAKLACQSCHKQSLAENVSFIIYKPLDLSCSSCHEVKNLQNSGSGS
jgi:hypothetical protein